MNHRFREENRYIPPGDEDKHFSAFEEYMPFKFMPSRDIGIINKIVRKIAREECLRFLNFLIKSRENVSSRRDRARSIAKSARPIAAGRKRSSLCLTANLPRPDGPTKHNKPVRIDIADCRLQSLYDTGQLSATRNRAINPALPRDKHENL